MGRPITKRDKKKAQAISQFLGVCVQKVEDKTKKLTTKLAVQFNVGDSQEIIQQSD